MRVGLDYLPAVAHVPGAGRYARELVRALVRLDDPCELALFEVGRAPRAVREPALGLAGATRVPPVHRVRARVPRRLLPALARLGLAADRWLGGVDVFHQTAPDPVPVRAARETFAAAEPPEAGSLAEARFAERCARAALVFAFSRHAESELERRFAPARVQRVPVGCDHWRRLVPEPPERDDPPALIVLGAPRAGRRHARLLSAVHELARRGMRLQLVVVGRLAHVLAGEVGAALARHAGVRLDCHAELPDPDLARRVAGASALVQLDDDAWTAVTPLEALALGTPVVASRLPCFEEALGREAIYVDNADVDRGPEALAGALEVALASAADPAARARRTARAAGFTWEACARATLAGWRAAAEA